MFVNCSLQDLYINNSDEILKPGECRKDIPQLLSVNTAVVKYGGHDKMLIKTIYVIVGLKLYEIGITDGIKSYDKYKGYQNDFGFGHLGPLYPTVAEATFCVFKFRENIIFTERESTLVVVEYCGKLEYLQQKEKKVEFKGYTIRFGDVINDILDHSIIVTTLEFGAIHVLLEKNKDPQIQVLTDKIEHLRKRLKHYTDTSY